MPCVSWKYNGLENSSTPRVLWPLIFQCSVEELPAVIKWKLSCSCIVPSESIIVSSIANCMWQIKPSSTTHDSISIPSYLVWSVSSATQLETNATFMPKQKATLLSCLDQVLLWPSGHVNLASYRTDMGSLRICRKW